MIELVIGAYVACTVNLAFYNGKDYVWQADEANCKITDIKEDKTAKLTFITVDCREQYAWLDIEFRNSLIKVEELNNGTCKF